MGGIGLKVPTEIIQEKCRRYLQGDKPTALPQRLNDSPFSIIAQYDAECRGVVEYYRMAYNLHRLNRLKWVMERSLTSTLAKKLQISIPKVYQRFHHRIRTERGERRVLRASVERDGKEPLVATWGDFDLVWRRDVILNDQPRQVWNYRNEIVDRLLANTCELCGSQDDIQVHHIRALKDLNRPGRAPKPAWMHEMAARQRKKLVVCQRCHTAIEHGSAQQSLNPEGHITGEPDAGKLARPVRRGADGKVPVISW